MSKTRGLTLGRHGDLQSVGRVHLPPYVHLEAFRIHVVVALRGNTFIDEENIYSVALDEYRNHSEAMAAATKVKQIAEMSREERIDAIDQGIGERARLDVLALSELSSEFPHAYRFNNQLLNGKGIRALVASLTFDAMEVDPVELETSIAGKVFELVYGDLPTTRRGRDFRRATRSFLEIDPKLDGAAIADASERWVICRHVHSGDVPKYKRWAEHKGNRMGDSYYQNWFPKFNLAFGYANSPLGRPSKKR